MVGAISSSGPGIPEDDCARTAPIGCKLKNGAMVTPVYVRLRCEFGNKTSTPPWATAGVADYPRKLARKKWGDWSILAQKNEERCGKRLVSFVREYDHPHVVLGRPGKRLLSWTRDDQATRRLMQEAGE